MARCAPRAAKNVVNGLGQAFWSRPASAHRPRPHVSMGRHRRYTDRTIPSGQTGGHLAAQQIRLRNSVARWLRGLRQRDAAGIDAGSDRPYRESGSRDCGWSRHAGAGNRRSDHVPRAGRAAGPGWRCRHVERHRVCRRCQQPGRGADGRVDLSSRRTAGADLIKLRQGSTQRGGGTIVRRSAISLEGGSGGDAGLRSHTQTFDTTLRKAGNSSLNDLEATIHAIWSRRSRRARANR